MDNSIFVKKLITGTKESALNWELVNSNKIYSSNKAYYLQKKDNKLVLIKTNYSSLDMLGEVVQDEKCSILICNDNYDKISEIDENDLNKSSDLSRLYRIVERKVNNVDDIMEKFVEDIEDYYF